jgi:hypothetical protein
MGVQSTIFCSPSFSPVRRPTIDGVSPDAESRPSLQTVPLPMRLQIRHGGDKRGAVDVKHDNRRPGPLGEAASYRALLAFPLRDLRNLLLNLPRVKLSSPLAP